MRLAYLGPVGTYGEQAAKQLAALAGLEASLSSIVTF
jgi:prephenate dehydratase